MIKHMVVFSLNHPKGSVEEKRFLADSEKILKTVPGVQDFEFFEDTNSTNEYSFVFSMVFDDEKALDDYLNHPIHLDYVDARWSEVKSFLVLDLKTI